MNSFGDNINSPESEYDDSFRLVEEFVGDNEITKLKKENATIKKNSLFDRDNWARKFNELELKTQVEKTQFKEKLLERMKSYRNEVRIRNPHLIECEWKNKLDGMNEMISIIEDGLI